MDTADEKRGEQRPPGRTGARRQAVYGRWKMKSELNGHRACLLSSNDADSRRPDLLVTCGAQAPHLLFWQSNRGEFRAARGGCQYAGSIGCGRTPDCRLTFESARTLFAELTPARLDLLNTLRGPGRGAAISRTPIETAPLIATGANALVRPAHDRMPVILHPAGCPSGFTAE